MKRLTIPATVADAPEASRAMLDVVAKQLGSVPNLFRAVALSPQALEGYLSCRARWLRAASPPPHASGSRLPLPK